MQTDVVNGSEIIEDELIRIPLHRLGAAKCGFLCRVVRVKINSKRLWEVGIEVESR